MEQYKSLLEIGLWVIVGTMGWFLRELWHTVKELRSNVHQVEVSLPSNYVRRDEHNDALKRIEEMLGKIFDKLDGKVDK